MYVAKSVPVLWIRVKCKRTYGQVPDRESEPLLGDPLMGDLSCRFNVARSSPARFSKSICSSKWTLDVSIVSCATPPVRHLMAVALFLALTLACQ